VPDQTPETVWAAVQEDVPRTTATRSAEGVARPWHSPLNLGKDSEPRKGEPHSQQEHGTQQAGVCLP